MKSHRLVVHPKVVNKQTRNSLCSCGSGLKYKKCCALTMTLDQYNAKKQLESIQK